MVTMRWFLLVIPLSHYVLSPVLAAVTLQVEPKAGAGTPVEVKWTREEEDPGHFDLRFILDGEDMGLVAAEVHAGQDELGGTAEVKFPKEGSYTLAAIGPHQANLGQSTEIEVASSTVPISDASSHDQNVFDGNAKVAQASPTPSPGTSTSSDIPSVGSASSSSNRFSIRRAAIIIGTILGTLVFLLILGIALLLFLRRRRARQEKSQRRVTFHREMMSQRRPGPIDLERSGGHLAASSALPSHPHTAFPGPTNTLATSRPASPLYTPVHEGPTERQIQLNKRTKQLEEIMHEIRFRPGMSRVLEQLRVQVSWLRAQRNSPWALGETDVPPQHYDLYMGR